MGRDAADFSQNRKVYCVYDDENQLVSWYRFQVSVDTLTDGDLRTDFVYDGRMRLRERQEYVYVVPSGGGDDGSAAQFVQPDSSGSGGTASWQLTSETHYIYDNNRVIQERDGSNNPLVSYTRGSDLSGSIEGAGGIGGLLARSSGYSSGNWANHYYYFADGNGNVTYMTDGSQALAASYRYDPVGNTISNAGILASANVYRFSSKEIHANSGMYYYLYRFYDPTAQRWINRDPVGERGGMNLYGYVANAPSRLVDPLGLTIWLVTRPTDGPPFYGFGTHAYLWDDRIPIQDHSVGLEAPYHAFWPGNGETSTPGDVGPVGPSDPTIPGFWDPLTGVIAWPVSGSEGRENEIMEYARLHINNTGWFMPPFVDCHSRVDTMLEDLGLTPPPHDRLNPGEHWDDLIFPRGDPFPKDPDDWKWIFFP